MLDSGTVSSNGRITIPKVLRDRHHLHEGELVTFLDCPDGVLVRHGKTALRGSLKGKLDVEKFETELGRLRSSGRE
jgi:AbrB family looped-hinge helix DNA binding protein